MNAYKYTSPKPLKVPEKCSNCPAICTIIDQADTRNAEIDSEVGAALNFDKEKHAFNKRFIAKYLGERSDETLEERRQRVAEALDQQEIDTESDQSDIDELTADCEGPSEGELTTRLGRDVIVTVCGSEAYGSGTDRFFTGPGHGQTQHEQVHVNRIAKPGE